MATIHRMRRVRARRSGSRKISANVASNGQDAQHQGAARARQCKAEQEGEHDAGENGQGRDRAALRGGSLNSAAESGISMQQNAA